VPTELPVDAARQLLSERLERWFYVLRPHSLSELLAIRLDDVHQYAGVRGAVGLSKTNETARKTRDTLAARRMRDLSDRALFLVPNHRLSENVAVRMRRDFGLNAEVWRGRSALDPEALPGAPETMCWALDRVNDVQKVRGDVLKSACGSEKPGPNRCPYRDECPYWRQVERCADAEVVVAAHEYLFHKLPREVEHDIAFVVLDESWWQSGLQIPAVVKGTGRLTHSVAVGGFAQHVLDNPGNLTQAEVVELWCISQKLESAMLDNQLGLELARLWLDDRALTLGEVETALKLEDRRKVEVKLRPGMAPKRWREEVARASINPEIWLRMQIWRAVRQLLLSPQDVKRAGRVVVAKDKAGHRVAKAYARRRIRREIRKKPILMLDATLKEEMIRPYLPKLELIADIDVRAEHQRTTLVQAPEGRNRKYRGIWAIELVERHLREIETLVLLHDGCVITREKTKNAMQRILEERKLHFKATVGLDLESFKTAPALFIVDRALPNIWDLADNVRALSGEAINPQVIWQQQTFATADGIEHTLRAPVYYNGETMERHRLLQATYEAIVVSEVMVQAPGRGRGINRTAANPLHVVMLVNDVVPPVRVDAVVPWEQLRPDIIDVMEAEGFRLESARDIAKLISTGASADAVRQMLKRARDRRRVSVTQPFIDQYMVPSRKWRGVTYRPMGRGQQTRRAWVAPEKLEKLREMLEAKLGKLAIFRVGD